MPAGTLTRAGSGARILLVEDNPMNQEVAAEFLRQAGLEVDIAENGRVALAKLDGAAFDLVFMDLQMSVMDGLVATRTLRAESRHAKLPVVAMTANALPEDRRHCLDAGRNDYLAKPIDPDKLLEVLRKRIAPRRGTVPAARQTAPAVPPAVADAARLDAVCGPLMAALRDSDFERAHARLAALRGASLTACSAS